MFREAYGPWMRLRSSLHKAEIVMVLRLGEIGADFTSAASTHGMDDVWRDGGCGSFA